MKRATKQELLADRIAGLEASVEYFSQAHKTERERWTVSEFLKNLRLRFKEADVRSPVNDPPDVEFRDARFEVVELLDPGRERHAEYKADLEAARKSNDPTDQIRMFTPVDLQMSDLYGQCIALAQKKAKKYSVDTRTGLDLLIYVNLTRIWDVVVDQWPSTEAMEALGWRSVSFVKGNRSCCFVARKDAPKFVRATVGQITHRWRLRRGV